jgi:hypothetical protein
MNSGARLAFNAQGVWAIYKFEMARALRTVVQSLITPVITTSLYFVVFGAAIGSRMSAVSGVSYGAFIVPGLIMLALFTESLANASFGIFFPKFIGTIYELLSAPLSSAEIVLGYVGAAASKSIVLGVVILLTAALFVPIKILHPAWIHFGTVGQGLGATAIDSDAGGHSLDVPGRRVLFNQHAAAGLAYVQLVQSHRVSHQRLSLVLLRHCGRQRRGELRHDGGTVIGLPRHHRVDFQDRVSIEELSGRSFQEYRHDGQRQQPRHAVVENPAPRLGAKHVAQCMSEQSPA